MRKFQCLLFVLKRSFICYYIICMTVPLSIGSKQSRQISYELIQMTFFEHIVIIKFGIHEIKLSFQLKQSFFYHYLKSVQIRSSFWSVFSRIYTEYVFSPNAGKYGPEITPYLDNFSAVISLLKFVFKGTSFFAKAQELNRKILQRNSNHDS